MSEPIPVIWFSVHDDIDARGPWDTRILEAMFDGSLWPHDMEFTHWSAGSGGLVRRGSEIMRLAVGSHRAIVVVPARHHVDDVGLINLFLSHFDSVLLILCGDEEGKFPWKDIKHPNIRFWVQMPHPIHYADMDTFGFFFGNGWGAATPELIQAGRDLAPEKDIAWSFSGQVTNSRRKQAANGLAKLAARLPGRFTATKGFAQGQSPAAYAAELARSWIVPCPSGPESVDTFRVYEALEAGAIPMVDELTPAGLSGYWSFAYGPNVPLPSIADWENAGGVAEMLHRFKFIWSATCSAWWQERKSTMVWQLEEDLRCLGFEMPEPQLDHPTSMMQALITTSPSPTNPGLDIIQETVASVEHWFGDVDILIACDGVRPEQEHLRVAYDEYLYNLTRWTNTKRNILPLISSTWLHQANLTRWAMNLVTKPAVLFMEHDAPLVTDEFIDWPRAVDVVANGHLDVLRFHHEAHVLKEHEHLMVDHHTRELLGVPVRRTRQWSQRPHLANSDYYRRILAENFNTESRTMIEDKMHSVVQSKPGHRLAIYHPDGNIKRSYHLDGRKDEPKFPMIY